MSLIHPSCRRDQWTQLASVALVVLILPAGPALHDPTRTGQPGPGGIIGAASTASTVPRAVCPVSDGCDGHTVPVDSVLEAPSTASLSPVWTNLTPNLGRSPLGRDGAAMTYDVADRYMLLFGGFNGSGPYTSLNDTWTFQDGRWTELHPTLSPPWLYSAGMAYDYSDGSVILFGGIEIISVLTEYLSAQTWSFHAGVWTNLTPREAKSPSPRVYPDLASDPTSQSVYLFGGTAPNSTNLNDTWVFRADAWNRLNESLSPPAVSGAGFAYSASSAGCVLFGGAPTNVNLLMSNQTWLLANGSWKNLTGSAGAPEARGWGVMAAYDATGDLVLFGGASGTSRSYVLLNSTWEYRNGTWSNASENFHPIQGEGGSFAIDPQDGYALMFGGADRPPTVNSSNAFFNNATWTFGPALLAKPVASPNPVDLGTAVSFVDPYNNASRSYSCSWQLGDGNTSTLQSFSHSYSRVGTYAVNLSVHDAFGHYNNSSVTVVVDPVPSIALQVVPSATDVGVPVNLSALVSNGSGPFRFAWDLGDGNSSSTASVLHAYAQPGRYTVSANVTDSDGLFRLATATVTVSALPTVSLAVSSTLLDVGETLGVLATTSNGTGPFSYVYSGLPTGCSGRNASSDSCQPSSTGNFTITVAIVDAVGAPATSVPSLVTVDPQPQVDLTASRAILDLGQSVSFGLSVRSTGAGGLTFAYLGLPPGCTALPSATYLTCTPTQVGVFEVAVNATDRTGAVASTTPIAITVNGRLGATWNGSAAVVQVGARLSLDVTVLGGTLPFTVSYYGLPPGCSSENATTLSCVPDTTGNYTTYVRVIDGTGTSVQSSWNVTVLAAPASTTHSRMSLLPYEVGGVAIVAMAVALLILVRRRKARRPPDPATGAEGSDGTATGERAQAERV